MNFRKALAVACCLSVGILGGCSPLSLSNNDTMRPPKTTGEEADIIKLIEKTAGSSYTLKYPENGTNRSAIVITDLNGDGENEAVAFYKTSAEATSTHMLIMYKQNDDWKISLNTQSQNTDVDRVEFSDINNDGTLEIIAGYKTYDANINQLSAFSYKDGTAESINVSQTYTSFVINDFNNNKCNDIMLFSISPERKSNASLLTYDQENNTLAPLASVPINPNITSFNNIVSGKITNSQIGAVVDGIVASDKTVSQVIYYNFNDNSLINGLYKEDDTQQQNPTLRDVKTYSTDIDNNSILDIPSGSKMPYSSDESLEAVASFVTWNTFDTDSATLVPQSNMVVNFLSEYYFSVSKEQIGHITARIDSTENSMTMYEWTGDAVGTRLFKIKTYKSGEWNKIGNKDGYKLLKQNSLYDYCYCLFDNSGEYKFSDEEIQKAFLAFSEYDS